MKLEIAKQPIGGLPGPRTKKPLAPSLRIAMTANNRALLRWMRAMELAAWLDADSPRGRSNHEFQAQRPTMESSLRC
jgi:hypothetical protein